MSLGYSTINLLLAAHRLAALNSAFFSSSLQTLFP